VILSISDALCYITWLTGCIVTHNSQTSDRPTSAKAAGRRLNCLVMSLLFRRRRMDSSVIWWPGNSGRIQWYSGSHLYTCTGSRWWRIFTGTG